MNLDEAQALLADVDSRLADALAAKDAAWQVWSDAKAAAKAISDERDPIAEETWRLEKYERDQEESEFREFFKEAKLSGKDPLKVALGMNGGSANG